MIKLARVTNRLYLIIAAFLFVVVAARIDLGGFFPSLPAWIAASKISYIPTFPGMNHLEEHEIFDPQYRTTKKIVFLGASAMDSLGCDGTWSKEDLKRNPSHNAAFACSITYRVNEILKENRLSNWRAFNLARNGSKLTTELFVYSQIASLNPEIVVFGDSHGYYAKDNAGAAELTKPESQIALGVFRGHQEAERRWRSYLAVLGRNGWVPRLASFERTTPSAEAGLIAIVSSAFQIVKRVQLHKSGQPLPLMKLPFHWDGDVSESEIRNVDPQKEYMRGFGVISAFQNQHGNAFIFLFLPVHQAKTSERRSYWDQYLGRTIQADGGLYSSELLDMEIEPVTETYDGVHQTVDGNRRIASGIINILRQKNLVR